MHIVYIVSSLEGGGAEFAIPDIIKTLESLGHKVNLLSCSKGDGMACSRLSEAGISYRILARAEDKRWKTIYNLFQYVKENNPDLIWTSLPRATLDGQIVGKILKIPVVSWQHSAFTKAYKAWAMPYLQKLSQFWISDSSSVSFYLKNKIKVPKSRIYEWPLFIAEPKKPQAQKWDENSLFRIGSLGRLHYHKDYPTLLRAFAHLRDFEPELYKKSILTIAGTGPDEDELRSLAASLGVEDRFELVGYLADPSEFLATLNVYVQPSRMEGMCIAAHEAMLAGVPILSTPVGELVYSVIDGQTGYHINHYDYEGITRYIVGFMSDSEKAFSMGLNARRFVIERFSQEHFVSCAKTIMAGIIEKTVEFS